MIDTHTHPYLEEFADGGAEVIDRAITAGVTHFILPNVDSSTVVPMESLHSRFPESTSMALGLHPTEVREDWKPIVEGMEKRLEEGGFVAVGEVGIDLYWDKTYRTQQIEAFTRQLRIADRLNLPVIIHCREGLEEVLACIEAVNPKTILIFHSFTGNPADVTRIRKVCDPMFGINGVVTFKNAASLREALPEIGISHILLETDAPYLAPVPHRGKRNEPAFVTHTCEKVAEVLGLSVKEVEAATDSNAKATFRL